MATRNGTPPPAPPATTETQIRRAYLATSADLARDLVATIDRSHREGYRLLRFGVPELDRALTIYPGSVTALVGRPGAGKSMLCKALARAEIDRIEREDAADRECVVYVTLEEPAEKLATQIGQRSFSWRGVMRGEIGDVRAARVDAIRVAKDLRSLFVIRQVGEVNGKRLPPLSTDQIFDTVEAISDEYGRRPTLVILDYLQLIRGAAIKSERAKTEEVMQASAGAVAIARALKAPVVVAVQASRETDRSNPPIPRLADMQWASSIEQDVDIALGLCRPAAVPSVQDDIARNGSSFVTVGNRSVTVTDTLMLLSPSKARDDGGAGKRYAIHVHPVTLEIRGIDWGSDE